MSLIEPDKFRVNIKRYSGGSYAANSNLPIIGLITIVFSFWIFLTIDMYVFSKLGIILSVIIALKFLDVLGRSIPMKELIVLLMLLQLIVTPVISYNYFGDESYYLMEVAENIYVDFVLLGIIAFIVGIYLKISPIQMDFNNLFDQINENKNKNGKIGITLILIGFASYFILPFVPPVFQFFVLLLSYVRFIGFFYLLFSNNKGKFIWLIIVFGSFAYSIIGEGLFINLFIWSLFLFIILSLQFRLTYIAKLALFIGGFFMIFFMQTFKDDYRKVIWGQAGQKEYAKPFQKGEKTKQNIFLDMAADRVTSEEDIYEYSNFNKFIARLNQGWILTNVLNHVPMKEPFTGGSMLLEDITASLLPRFLNPSKRTSGGDYGREKFMRFTGRYLQEGTRMTIGTFGDAYVNFGPGGGIAFMFAFGLALNLLLKYIYSLSLKRFPTLVLWLPFLFLYAMRAGNEFLMIFNYTLKSSLVVFLIFLVYKQYFVKQRAA
ncbi:MAG TPA: hypothetical protein EYN69_10335 [Flavobacteriales bacterium]|nr:hypothetical protein [Flavobacteriales bacterium]